MHVCAACGVRDLSKAYKLVRLAEADDHGDGSNHWIKVDPAARDAVRRREAVRLYSEAGVAALLAGGSDAGGGNGDSTGDGDGGVGPDVELAYADFLNQYEHDGTCYHVIPNAVVDEHEGSVNMCPACHAAFVKGAAAQRYAHETPGDLRKAHSVERGPSAAHAAPGYYAKNAPPNSVARGDDYGRYDAARRHGVVLDDVSILEQLVLAKARCHQVRCPPLPLAGCGLACATRQERALHHAAPRHAPEPLSKTAPHAAPRTTPRTAPHAPHHAPPCHAQVVVKLVKDGRDHGRIRLVGHTLVFEHAPDMVHRDALRSDAAEWSEERIRDAIDGIQVVFVGPTGKQEGLERSALWLNDLRLRPAVVINHLLLRHGLLGSDASQGGASLPDTSVLRRIVRVARERREWLVADGAVRIEDDSVERLAVPSDPHGVREAATDGAARPPPAGAAPDSTTAASPPDPAAAPLDAAAAGTAGGVAAIEPPSTTFYGVLPAPVQEFAAVIEGLHAAIAEACGDEGSDDGSDDGEVDASAEEADAIVAAEGAGAPPPPPGSDMQPPVQPAAHSTRSDSPSSELRLQLEQAVEAVYAEHKSELPVSVKTGAVSAIRSDGFGAACSDIAALKEASLEGIAFCVLNAVARLQAASSSSACHSTAIFNVPIAMRLKLDLVSVDVAVTAIVPLVTAAAGARAAVAAAGGEEMAEVAEEMQQQEGGGGVQQLQSDVRDEEEEELRRQVPRPLSSSAAAARTTAASVASDDPSDGEEEMVAAAEAAEARAAPPAAVPPQQPSSAAAPPHVRRMQREDKPRDDYSSAATTIYDAWWQLFPLRQGLHDGKALPDGKMAHMALYYDNRFAQTLPLIFHLANIKLRHAVNRAVGLRVKSSNEAFRGFQERVASPRFLALLEEAAKDPHSAAGREVLEEVLPFINLVGRKIPWGTVERAGEVTKHLALHRRCGPASVFMSLAPDDVHDLLVVRMAHAFTRPNEFPATEPADFGPAVLDGGSFTTERGGAATELNMSEDALQKLAAHNPVAATHVFQLIVDNVMGSLVGVDRKTAKKVPEMGDLLPGIYGSALHATYVKECNKRGSQHIHGQVWTALLPSLLADVAHDDELLRLACEALDTQLCAELPLEYIAAGAAMRALGTCGARLRSRRDAAVPLPETDEDFLHHAQLVVLNRNWHEHRARCTQTKPGRTSVGCELCRPAAHPMPWTTVTELIINETARTSAASAPPVAAGTATALASAPASATTTANAALAAAATAAAAAVATIAAATATAEASAQRGTTSELLPWEEDDDSAGRDEGWVAGADGGVECVECTAALPDDDDNGQQHGGGAEQRSAANAGPDNANVPPPARAIDAAVSPPPVATACADWRCNHCHCLEGETQLAADTRKGIFYEAEPPRPRPAEGNDLRPLATELRRRLLPAVPLEQPRPTEDAPPMFSDAFNRRLGDTPAEYASLNALEKLVYDKCVPAGTVGRRARELVGEVLRGPLGALLRKPGLEALRDRLEQVALPPPGAMGPPPPPDAPPTEALERQAEALLAEWAGLCCANGKVVEHSLTLSGCTRANANPIPLGAGAASKGCSMYQIKYMGKDSVQISASASVLVQAFKDIKKYPSTAADSGSATRTTMHFAQRVLNHVSMELEATQAAAIVLGHASSAGTDEIEFHSSWDYVRLARHLSTTADDDSGMMPGDDELEVQDAEATAAVAVEATEEAISDAESDAGIGAGVEPVDVGQRAAPSVHQPPPARPLYQRPPDVCHGGGAEAETETECGDGDPDFEEIVLDTMAGAADGEDEATARARAHELVAAQLADMRQIDPTAGTRAGFSRVYTGNTGKPVPASDAEIYAWRDRRLAHFNALEFRQRFKLRPIKPLDREPRQTSNGEQPSLWDIAYPVGAEAVGQATQRPAIVYGFCEQEGGGQFKLRENYFLTPRSKWGVYAFAGKPPPKEPPAAPVGGRISGTLSAARRDYARYCLANFVPWELATGTELELTWDRWVAWVDGLRRTLGMPPAGGTEVSEAEAAAPDSEEFEIAAGRLFDIENAATGFRVERQAAVMLAKHRARSRDWWNDANRPAAGPSGASADAKRAARELAQWQERLKQQLNKDDICTRLNTSSRMEKWAGRLAAALPTSRFGADVASDADAEQHLRRLWPHAAFPSTRTQEQSIPPADVDRLLKELIQPVQPASAGQDPGAADVADAGDSHDSAGQPPRLDDACTDDCERLAVISGKDWEAAFAEWEVERAAAKRDSIKAPPAPLNPEQRDVCRAFLQATRHCAAGRRQSTPAHQIDAQLAQQGLDRVLLLHGPGGTGKSAAVHEIAASMRSSGCGELLVTAYTGVAAAPFGGPTLLSLLGMGIIDKSVAVLSPRSAAAVVTMRDKFRLEAGRDIAAIGALCIDEVSFNDARLFGHVDHRLRLLTGNLQSPFGGLPVLLCGDNYQKPPPKSTPWFQTLVQDSLKVRDGDTAEGQGGCRSAIAAGLAVLRLARRFTLWRNMRAHGNPAFADWLAGLRRGRAGLPVSDVSWLRELSASDGPVWRFAPVGVLARRERDAINCAQVEAFARAFGLPLFKWKLQLQGDVGVVMPASALDELYRTEQGLWGYFVAGAPVLLTDNIRSTRKLVNGSPALLDSLTFREGQLPGEVAAAYRSGGFKVVELAEAPYSVNVRVDRGDWHGIDLGDLSAVGGSATTADGTIVPLKCNNGGKATVSGTAAAINLPTWDLEVKHHGFQLAFAMTDNKLQACA